MGGGRGGDGEGARGVERGEAGVEYYLERSSNRGREEEKDMWMRWWRKGRKG